jgi:hypothetical protein
MKFLLVTTDPEVEQAAREGFHPADTFESYRTWQEALNHVEGVDLMFVDLLSTLHEPHKIAGYEEFAIAKMGHEVAKEVPLVVISPPEDYELDFMTGWPNFVLGHIRRPVNEKIFRRASTWV